MAKIGKIEIPFGVVIIDGEVHYNARRSHFFIKGLPENFEKDSGFKNEAETEAEIVREVTAAAKRLAEAQTKEEFFIDVIFTVGSEIIRRDKFFDVPFDHTDTVLSRFRRTFSNPRGFGFMLSHKLICRVSVLENHRFYGAGLPFSFDNKEPRTIQKHGDRASVDGFLIPYTPERVQFFEQMEKALGRMAFQIADFMAQTPEDLHALIDAATMPAGLPESLKLNNDGKTETLEV